MSGGAVLLMSSASQRASAGTGDGVNVADGVKVGVGVCVSVGVNVGVKDAGKVGRNVAAAAICSAEIVFVGIGVDVLVRSSVCDDDNEAGAAAHADSDQIPMMIIIHVV